MDQSNKLELENRLRKIIKIGRNELNLNLGANISYEEKRIYAEFLTAYDEPDPFYKLDWLIDFEFDFEKKIAKIPDATLMEVRERFNEWIENVNKLIRILIYKKLNEFKTYIQNDPIASENIDYLINKINTESFLVGYQSENLKLFVAYLKENLLSCKSLIDLNNETNKIKNKTGIPVGSWALFAWCAIEGKNIKGFNIHPVSVKQGYKEFCKIYELGSWNHFANKFRDIHKKDKRNYFVRMYYETTLQLLEKHVFENGIEILKELNKYIFD